MDQKPDKAANPRRFQFSVGTLLVGVPLVGTILGALLAYRLYLVAIFAVLYAVKFAIWKVGLRPMNMVAVYSFTFLGMLGCVYAGFAEWHDSHVPFLFNLLLLPAMILAVPTATFVLDVVNTCSGGQRTLVYMGVRAIGEIVVFCPACYVFCISVGLVSGLVHFPHPG